MLDLDKAVKDAVTAHVTQLEKSLSADIAFYYGPIDSGLLGLFRDFLEKLAASSQKQKRLALFVNSPGGSAEAAEKMVDIIRHHYRDVSFVVPDFALSAATILCMSGDRIYMDYSSSLGPIDPQIFNGKEWVPALGYLDKVEQLLQKARDGTLTNAEFLILQSQDLALLSRYEQARDLTVTLLKKWLVEYKFRDWRVHATDLTKKGNTVTEAEKQERAEQIAKHLGNHKLWHSHGRLIGPQTLWSVLKLKIDDYSHDKVLRPQIRGYSDLLRQYITKEGFTTFLHSREYF